MGVPHPIPYQGSKRWLAKAIIDCLPKDAQCLFEPFAGSAAVTLAAASRGVVDRFVLNDINRPLTELWRMIVDNPEETCRQYALFWNEQHGREREYYNTIRDAFNKTQEPCRLLYLLARCVKACVRYNTRGEFNNSPDNRRRGAHPDTMSRHIRDASQLLKGKIIIDSRPYQEILSNATARDVVYMDPPYQGVCLKRNQRYLGGVDYDDFVSQLHRLNARHVAFIVSYDGRTGDKTHGQMLPESLNLHHIEVEAGRSTQATLLGRNDTTYEALYLSPSLLEQIGDIPKSLLPPSNHDNLLFADAI